MTTRSIMGLAGIGPARPLVPLVGGLSLAAARAHEICGPARRTLACMMAGSLEGPVIWIVAQHERDRLHPAGVAEMMEPGRLVFVTPRRAQDMLWTAEEALRAGVVPLVVADLQDPPALTPVRRLHLAAETGMEEGRVAPVTLLLTPGDGGAPGIETRWWMAPRHREGRAWRLERRRSRAEPPAAWDLAPNGRLTPPD
jgi:protein ImuA